MCKRVQLHRVTLLRFNNTVRALREAYTTTTTATTAALLLGRRSSITVPKYKATAYRFPTLPVVSVLEQIITSNV